MRTALPVFSSAWMTRKHIQQSPFIYPTQTNTTGNSHTSLKTDVFEKGAFGPHFGSSGPSRRSNITAEEQLELDTSTKREQRRKIQNRVAQRNYREKQRHRLAELERKLAEDSKTKGKARQEVPENEHFNSGTQQHLPSSTSQTPSSSSMTGAFPPLCSWMTPSVEAFGRAFAKSPITEEDINTIVEQLENKYNPTRRGSLQDVLDGLFPDGEAGSIMDGGAQRLGP